ALDDDVGGAGKRDGGVAEVDHTALDRPAGRAAEPDLAGDDCAADGVEVAAEGRGEARDEQGRAGQRAQASRKVGAVGQRPDAHERGAAFELHAVGREIRIRIVVAVGGGDDHALDHHAAVELHLVRLLDQNDALDKRVAVESRVRVGLDPDVFEEGAGRITARDDAGAARPGSGDVLLERDGVDDGELRPRHAVVHNLFEPGLSRLQPGNGG